MYGKLLENEDSYPEKSHGAAALEGAVGYVGLLGEIGRVLNRRYHPLDGEKSRQVGRVRGYYYEGEEPPDAADYSRARGLRVQNK